MKKKIFFIGSFVLFLFTLIFTKNIYNLDELWNYNFSRCIVNGLIPYKDINLIIFPLSIYINSILLLLGNYLYIFRISYFIILLFNSYLIYKILKYLNIKDIFIYIINILISYLLVKYTYNDYNTLQITLLFLVMYLELINKNNFFIGIILGLIILNKQSTGLIICLSSFLIVFLNKYYLKENLKIKKVLFYRILGLIIPLFILVIYLLIFNNFNSFIDLTILGLKGFTNTIFVNDLKIILLVAILVYLMMIIYLIKNKDRNILILLILSLANFFVLYPICDLTHLIFGIIPYILLFTYYYKLKLDVIKNKINKLVNHKIFNSFKLIKYSVPLTLLLISIINVRIYFTNYNHNLDNTNYRYLLMEDDIYEYIVCVSDYIKNNDKVIVLDKDAAIFMIYLDRYNKNYDLFNVGNFGYYGEKEIYKDLDNNDYLILISNNLYYQKPNDITNYVINNYKMKDYIINNKNYIVYTIYQK